MKCSVPATVPLLVALSGTLALAHDSGMMGV